MSTELNEYFSIAMEQATEYKWTVTASRDLCLTVVRQESRYHD